MSSSFYCKSIIVVLMVFLLASCGAKKSSVTNRTNTIHYDIVDYGKKYLHRPYRYAGKGPNSFDCSGYTAFVFRKFGYNLNASAEEQERQSVTVKRKEDLQVGDLVFFEGRSHNGRVGHVGIVSEKGRKGEFKFIHASTTNGVIITSSNEPYYRSRYLRGGRIITERRYTETNQQTRREEKKYNQIKDKIVYKETDNGFAIIDNQTGQPLKNSEISSEPPLKPSKKTQKENKKKEKEKPEIRQQAIAIAEESPTPTASRITHKVKPGETLFKIAQKYKCSVEQLQTWNPEIENNKIQAGEEINIYQ